MQSVNHNGMTFPNEQALHEWRLIFEFDYFMEQAEQNLLINQILSNGNNNYNLRGNRY